ncbi:MAG: hypothetical protein ACR2PT_01980 [Endozoicomonas sp.]
MSGLLNSSDTPWVRLLLLAFFLPLLGGCPTSNSESLSGEQLQDLVNDSYLSPQLRRIELLPMVSVQLYLETPRLTVQADDKPLRFELNGRFDADFLGNNVTETIPINIIGTASLVYRPDDHGFYFDQMELSEARIDLELALVQALMMDHLKKALHDELLLLPIIPLRENQALYQKLDNRAALVKVKGGRVVIDWSSR